MDIIQFTAPACYASYFVNGDWSGLEEDDRRDAEAIIDTLVKLHGSCHIHDAEDIGFKSTCDYGSHGLAGDMCLYSLLA